MKKLMNMLLPLAALGAALWLAGCDDDKVSATRTTSGTTEAPAATTPIAAEPENAKTVEQWVHFTDLWTTQQIRRAFLTDPSLSADGKNVSVITTDGVVTLRGSVKTEAEHAAIAAKAKELAGNDRVDDFIAIGKTPVQPSTMPSTSTSPTPERRPR